MAREDDHLRFGGGYPETVSGEPAGLCCFLYESLGSLGVPSFEMDTKVICKEDGLDYGRGGGNYIINSCLLYTSPSPRDRTRSRMPSSA